MDEQNKMIETVVDEIKSAKDDELRNTIEKWFEQTRNQGLKIGASYIAAAVAGVMEKHLKKGKDASRRDLERCLKDIYRIVSVQLNTQQSDLEEDDDGTAEEIG